MDEELVFRILLLGIYAIFGVIRLFFRIPASKREGKKYEPGKLAIWLLSIGILGYFATLILYMLYIPWILLFNLVIPSIVRWISALIALLCTPLLYWIHSTLGKQYSANLEIQKAHSLITTGPYRHVRHPMYTIFIVFSITIALITANLLPIICSLIISLSLPSIAKKEEQMLIDTFGDEYLSYMKRSGRFLPSIPWPNS